MATEVRIRWHLVLHVLGDNYRTFHHKSFLNILFILIEEMTGVEDTMIVEGMTEIEIEGMTDVILTKDLDKDMVVLIYDLK